ncbi:hypothetical protein N7481_012309 [Penicillium waksmanii]|uniref:uncharacterized protein n=1 Tax=Penicillium waksmanii TaxID=69791 RepID=UPI002546F3D8|nr:uncharacterized protein N7481_012309 [Penicillium waksmanii]KAJ5965595.1 hypothetical protein N7481_012309 [Penicillium waksmanii]
MALSISDSEKDRKPSFREFLDEDIAEDILLESELLLLSFATGIQDAAAWPDYMCFASNQTGNTLFLAIGVAGLAHDAFSFANIGVSLSLFIAGGFIMGQLGNYFGVRRRLWLLISNFIQTALVFCALMIQYAWPIQRDGPAALAVIACLAFSSGAQVAMARSLKITEITTAMATAAFIDVVIDPSLTKIKNRLRNRRVMFLVMLTLGCFVGAFAQREVSSSFPIMLCAIAKAMVNVAFLFNRPITPVAADMKV